MRKRDDDDTESAGELQERLSEALRLNKAQLAASARIREELREIGDRIARGGFVILVRPTERPADETEQTP